MGKVSLDPYLFFKGDCKDAMEFYKSVFGGELTLQTYEDVNQSREGMEGKIMHARLSAPGFTILGSDTPNASAKIAKVSLTLGGDDEDQLRKIFEGLSAGGEVTSELKTEFWGDTFGTLTDKFNVDWMVNISAK